KPAHARRQNAPQERRVVAGQVKSLLETPLVDRVGEFFHKNRRNTGGHPQIHRQKNNQSKQADGGKKQHQSKDNRSRFHLKGRPENVPEDVGGLGLPLFGGASLAATFLGVHRLPIGDNHD